MSSRRQLSFIKTFRVVMMTVVLAMLASSIAHAQLHQWSQGFGGLLDDSGFSIARDNSGNILVTGSFNTSITLGGHSHASKGGTDIFIVKFDASGNELWHRVIGEEGVDAGFGICTDSNGAVIVTGQFYGGEVDFGGNVYPSSMGGGDVFVVKYDSSGGFAWVWTSELLDSGVDIGRDVCVDAENNVYVTGSDARWYPTQDNIFLVKLNGSDGTAAWQKLFGGSGNDSGTGICANGTDVTITGYFGEWTSSSVNFGGQTLESAGGKDIFLATFNSSGTHLASQRFGGTGNDEATGICSDANGYVYVTGWFYGGVNFGVNYYESDEVDMFLLKMTPYTGGVRYTVWDKAFGGDYCDAGQSVAVGSDGAVYLTGYFQWHVNFGGEDLTALTYSAKDVFVAKFDASGSHLWSRNWGGTLNGNTGMDIVVASDGYLFVTGNFSGSANFGGAQLVNNGGLDVFVAKYSSADAITGLTIPTTFDAGTYTWDATMNFTTTAATMPEIMYSQSMDCLPCDFFGSYAGFQREYVSGTSHSILLPDLLAATSYCYTIHAYVDENALNYLSYAGSFPLTNSYAPIYGISHSFSAMSCRILVGWYTKYPSKNNTLYYRKTGTTTWSSTYAAEKECDDPDYLEEPDAYNLDYVGFFSVREGTSYQFKISTQINGVTYWSSVMSRSSGHCDHNPPIPREEASPRSAQVAAPFVRAYPNPFNPTTMVSFNVPATADVELRIYGADGGYVKTLASGAFAAGVHNVAWDGTNERGEKVSSGIYFAKFEYGEGSLTSKLILLR